MIGARPARAPGRLEGLDQAVLLGHAADPLVALDAHRGLLLGAHSRTSRAGPRMGTPWRANCCRLRLAIRATTGPRLIAIALPERRFSREVLIEEGVATDRIYVLKSGALDVVRGTIRMVAIREPGSYVGHSRLLDREPMASVSATETASSCGRGGELRSPATTRSPAPSRGLLADGCRRSPPTGGLQAPVRRSGPVSR